MKGREARFANDWDGVEGAFARACVVSLDGTRQRGLAERAVEKAKRALRRAGQWLLGGVERVAERKGVEWARGGWVHVAPSDVWRFDTGGGKRILGIAGEMGKEARVLILSWGEAGDGAAFRESGGGVAVLRVRKGAEGERLAGRVLEAARGWVFENPLQYVPWKEKRKSSFHARQLIYDATNVFTDAYGKLGIESSVLESAERCLLEDADCIWFCTDSDRETTKNIHGGAWMPKTGILPNGIYGAETVAPVVPSETRATRESVGWNRPVVLFAGANYGPNDEAVGEIAREWAPRFPAVTFVVLGMRLDRYLRGGGTPPARNMVFTGLVREEEKKVLYDLSEVAIVPVRRGTGSSLKVPEAIARGKVVIGTRVGLRGFGDWTKWESVMMEEEGWGALGKVLERLAVEPGAYDEACRGAAEEMQRRYTWGALMERWRGMWT